jgi:hypothetical protein
MSEEAGKVLTSFVTSLSIAIIICCAILSFTWNTDSQRKYQVEMKKLELQTLQYEVENGK